MIFLLSAHPALMYGSIQSQANWVDVSTDLKKNVCIFQILKCLVFGQTF